MSDLKSIIRNEYIKCASDPFHFIKKYCFIQHPQRGRILFTLFPFQEKTLEILKNNDNTIINKSRQLGISTLAAAFSLWLMLFHKDKLILCLATKQDTAKNMVTKVRFMYDNLPSWLKIEAIEKNKLSLSLVNGSKIIASSAASDAGRSYAASVLIIDECGFIENIEPIWASASQTLATGGKSIILSTPNGTGNWFHKEWVKATNKENQFVPVQLPWQVHPERNQSWRDEQDTKLGDPRIAAQECDCVFTTTGDTVFFPELLTYYESLAKDPTERRGLDKNLWIWEAADFSRKYAIICDVARGNGSDYSAFHVMDIEANTQVAEYKGQISTSALGHLLVATGWEYNEALLVIENANIGWATIQTVTETGYRNIYHSPRGESMDSSYDRYADNSNKVIGFTTSLKTRPLVVGKFREFVNDKSVSINSKRLLEEMRVFVWKHGRAEAQTGYNDDLIMSFAIGLYLRDTALKNVGDSDELSKACLNNISVGRQVYNSRSVNNNPYKINTGYGNMDISWVLGK